MNFFRNKDVQNQLRVHLGLTILWGVAGMLLYGANGWVLFVAGISFSLNALLFTYWRYRKLAAISQDIDMLLHGDESIRFDVYKEGELAVLQNEISKMTVRLLEQAQRLRQERTYLTDSLADISHQLKTPLTSLEILNATLSREKMDDQQRIELVREQMQLLSRMEWLITVLLKISRLDAGTITFENASVPVKELIQMAVMPLEVALELKQQSCHVQIENDILFFGDITWTAEALGNIIKNCMEHTPDGGRIDIIAKETPFQLEIVIQDNGSGFSSEELPHLFERFYHGKHSSKNSVGIGLALSKAIISRQKGTILAENRKTKGARFKIYLNKK